MIHSRPTGEHPQRRSTPWSTVPSWFALPQRDASTGSRPGHGPLPATEETWACYSDCEQTFSKVSDQEACKLGAAATHVGFNTDAFLAGANCKFHGCKCASCTCCEDGASSSRDAEVASVVSALLQSRRQLEMLLPRRQATKQTARQC